MYVRTCTCTYMYIHACISTYIHGTYNTCIQGFVHVYKAVKRKLRNLKDSPEDTSPLRTHLQGPKVSEDHTFFLLIKRYLSNKNIFLGSWGVMAKGRLSTIQDGQYNHVSLYEAFQKFKGGVRALLAGVTDSSPLPQIFGFCFLPP